MSSDSDDLAAAEAAARAMRARRPGPAIPLLALAVVVLGAIPVSVLDGPLHLTIWSVLTAYWVLATLAAYFVVTIAARRQGYHSGIWVDRSALIKGGVAALAVLVLWTEGGFAPAAPGDLTVRGFTPLLAISLGVCVWAYSERSAGLWVVGLTLVATSLLVNLYDVENLLYRLGMPLFDGDEAVANLGLVAAVLLVAAATFGYGKRRRLARVGGVR